MKSFRVTDSMKNESHLTKLEIYALMELAEGKEDDKKYSMNFYASLNALKHFELVIVKDEKLVLTEKGIKLVQKINTEITLFEK
mgnify:FL=1